jgi:hypothetical protein
MTMKVWDVQCQLCSAIECDLLFQSWESPVENCGCGGSRIKIHTFRYKRTSAVHSSERIVVFRNPQTGEVKYPGRNDQPMPDRYRHQGYERVELSTLHDATRFEKQHGVFNEVLHYDSNGKSFKEDPAPPSLSEVVKYSDLTQ